eukprot:Hpha_TRINITY_DN23790_c0_g1::TRINITY_DN23790_c0_g1_i1::g.93132::m.93132
MAGHQLAALLAEDFAVQHADNPEFASQSGNHQHDDKLQDLSPEAFDRRAEHNRAMMQRAEAITASELTAEEQLHLKLFISDVQCESRAWELGSHLYPINSIGCGGVAANFVETMEWQEENAPVKLVARLEAFPRQCEQYTALLRRGVSEKRVASKAMLRKIGEQILGLADGDELVKVVTAAVSPGSELSARADAALEGFRVACRELERYVREEYAPHARDQSGCCGLPGEVGAEAYALALRYHTTTTMTADEIHEIGLSEVSRIKQRYATDVMAPLGFSGTFAEFVEGVRADEAHVYSTQGELLDGYRALCAEIEGVLPAFFEKFPVSPLEIVSKNNESAPAAYYLAGTPDGKRPGRFYVNASNLNKRPKYEMPALALHEAIPGHHHQCALALENPTVPDFLRYLEDRRYEFCPARRQMYTGYLEGWALYCEALGEEMGIYKTPIQIFGRLSMEMMRAVRLVVDTGIHAKKWEVEDAVTYMMEATGMHRHECVAECYRYEAWPGQACAYKVGEIAIWRMRREAEEKLGDRFDLKAFHSVLLMSGPMPLDALRSMVERWVDAQLQ